MIAQAIRSRMSRVFLETGKDFGLVWNGKQYVLKNQKTAVCHPLEICLIGMTSLSGSKIQDINRVLKKGYRWILGFHHAILSNKPKYKNAEYLAGYHEGKVFTNET